VYKTINTKFDVFVEEESQRYSIVQFLLWFS